MQGHFPAMKVADSQTNDGRKVTFLIPHDAAPSDLILAPIGTKLMIGYAQYTEAEEAPQVEQPVEQPKAEKERRRFEDMPASQQAGIRCGEVEYQRWLPEAPSTDATIIKPPSRPMPPAVEDARYRLCYRLSITSLRELDTDVYARDEFRELDRQYRIDTGKEPWRP